MAYLVARPHQGVRVPVLRWAGSGRVVGPVQGLGGVCCVKRNGRWFARNPWRPNELCPHVIPPPGMQGLGVYFHRMPGGDVCRCGRPGMQGLGDAASLAAARAIEEAKQLAILGWSLTADKMAQDLIAPVNVAVENVRRSGGRQYVNLTDLNRLWGAKTLVEKTSVELARRVMDLLGKAPYQMSNANPGERAFLQARRSLRAISELADVGLSSYGNLGNDPDAAAFAEFSNRYEALLQSWAGAASSAASAAGSAVKNLTEAAKSGAEALKGSGGLGWIVLGGLALVLLGGMGSGK